MEEDELSLPSSPSQHPGTRPIVLRPSPCYSVALAATPLQQMGSATTPSYISGTTLSWYLEMHVRFLDGDS